MKKVTAFFLAAIMAVGLTACAGSNDNNTSSGTTATNPPASTTTNNATTDSSAASSDSSDTVVNAATDEPVNLKVWMDNDEWADAVINAFTAKYPNVSIEYQNVGNVDSRAKLTLDGPAGVGADVFFYPHDNVALAVADGLVEPVPADLQAKYRNELLGPAVDTVTLDGDMYGVPISTENIALFYNKDLYGPNPPSTFEEIIDFAKTYNNPANNDWAIAWAVDDSYHNFFWLTAAGMELFGPNHDDFRAPGWDTPQAAKGVEYFLRMKECFDVPVSDTTWENTVKRFQTGEIPFTISGPWAIGDAKTNGVNFGVAKLPTIEGNQPWCFSGLIVGNVSSYSENKEWAYIFLDFIVSEEGAGILYDLKGMMTSRSDISTIPGLRDDEYLSGIAQQAPYSIPMPIIPEVNQMWDSQKCLFQFTWDGDMTIPEAQEKAMDTYRNLLAAAGKTLD